MIDARRLGPFLLAFILLLCAVVPAAVHAREMVSAARAEVDLRTGPGARREVAWVLSRGYPLEVLGRRGAWLRVRDFENDRGWVLRSQTGRKAHHIVTARVANLRSKPGMASRVLGKARYGDVLRTLERRGDWIKVRHERGAVGWIARRLVWGW